MDAALRLSLFTALLSLVGALTGAYFGGYLGKKAENKAMHEDLGMLKDQVAMVTATTKKIETEISDAAWNRQKRRELKREVLFEAAKTLTEVDDALQALSVAVWAEIDGGGTPEVNKLLKEKVDETRKAWRKAAEDFEKTNGLVTVTCDLETYKAFLELRVRALHIAVGLRENPNTYDDSKKELAALLAAARSAIRKELGIEE